MKERPILFSSPMVRAILAGTKTQTRRIVKPHPSDDAFCLVDYGDGYWPYRSEDGESPNVDNMEYSLDCPYGQPGDRLWVRETWSSDFASHYPFDRVWYAADDDRKRDIERRDGVRGIYSPESAKHVSFNWHPSIHMPRAASRINLEVTGVRVERLQDISEADALAEGINEDELCDLQESWDMVPDKVEIGISPRPTAISFYRNLWESINGPGSWDANPWVWCVDFKRVRP